MGLEDIPKYSIEALKTRSANSPDPFLLVIETIKSSMTFGICPLSVILLNVIPIIG